MQRSSETIAKLASALAKAQIELVNPEKSLVATIYPDGASQEGRTFNYASLASGLEIVRKTLGQHEIATVQTTSLDEAAQIVKLTTVLAHSSGEWISSDWPVCAVAETGTPHRMGAALTYARRYALFTLVGIAGEDDRDAPDLVAPAQPIPVSQGPSKAGNGHLNGGPSRSVPGDTSSSPRLNGQAFGRQKSARREGVPRQILPPDQSAALRDRLVAEIDHLACPDEAAHWARRSLPEKAKLAAADEQSVEKAFQEKLLAVGAVQGEQSDRAPRHALQQAVDEQPGATKPPGPRHPDGIDKSVLALPEPRRLRDRDHMRYVAQQPCLICGRRPSDAHHLRFAQHTALGRKVSDEFTVPLCRGHHRELHRYGDESTWWRKVVIDPTLPARKLWLETHPLPNRPVEGARGERTPL